MRPLLAAVVLAVVPSVAPAAGPVCALLDPEKHPRAALLEAKLLADPAATWVERNAVDAVLKEQKLQALFGPQGVGDRVRLGKLLKADLLVSVRPVKGVTEPALEVVVSETAGGLRLLVRGVPVTADPNADTAALAEAVRDGLRKWKNGEKAHEVVAVPPFVGQDLTYEFEHLRAAYARLAEGAALARPGVLVVELAEAEALAREIDLAAPGTPLSRPLPLYLLGGYRHEGKGKDRTVTLRLQAERGGKPVGDPVARTVKPDEAATAIRAWVGGVPVGGGAAPTPDPKAEADQLAARALDFRRLGYWIEAVDLYDAALLLDPSRIALHIEVVSAVSQYNLATEDDWPWHLDLAVHERGLRAHRRGLTHLEAYVDKGGDLSGHLTPVNFFLRQDKHSLMCDFTAFGYQYRVDGKLVTESRERGPAVARERFFAVQREQRDVLLRIIPAVARQGKTAEAALIRAAVYHLPREAKYALLGDLIFQLKDLPRAKERTIRYVGVVSSAADRNRPEYRRLVERLLASDHRDLRAAGATLKRSLEAPRKDTDPAPPDPNEPRPQLATFRPIELAFDPGEHGWRASRELTALVRAGPGVDVLATFDSLFVMKEKGKPRRVWAGLVNDRSKISSAFTLYPDGRYVWVTVKPTGRPSMLLVVDPAVEKVYEVTAAHRLPDPGPGAASWVTVPKVAPLGPGRVGLAGTLAYRGRTWVGVATFDPATGPAVKVIHEARVAPDQFDRGKQGTGPEVAFGVGGLVAARDQREGGSAGVRLLLYRSPPIPHTIPPPMLLIDPDRETVEVLPEERRPNWRQSPPDREGYLVG